MSVTEFEILAGRDYTYTGTGAYHGHRYRVHRFVLDVPVYATKVLVQCLSGPSEGEWFVVTPANFARRYTLAINAFEDEPPAVCVSYHTVHPVEQPAPDVPASEETLANYW